MHAKQSAIALGARVAACGELSLHTQLEAEVAGLFTKVILLKGNEKLLVDGRGVRTDDHALVLVAAEPILDDRIRTAARVAKGSFIGAIKLLREVVVIDPYLQRVVEAKNIHRDEDFCRRLAALKATNIANGVAIDGKLSEVIAERDRLIAYVASERKIEQLEKTIELPTMPPFLVEKRKEQIIQKLIIRFPGITWSENKKKTHIFMKGPEDITTSVSEFLGSRGIKFTIGNIVGEENKAILINVADYFSTRSVHDVLCEKPV
ncbi:MAG: hypothetical protein NTX49_10230 [Chlamydiae bacterium]|nr:hypothetical protein [Chlamydiota bacterium]